MADVEPQDKTGGPIGQSAGYCDPEPFFVAAQGQRINFFPAGGDRREALLAMIAQARESVRMSFYIFSEDQTGVLVRDALVAAAQRGVAVTLIVDGFGGAAGPKFFAPLVAAGGRHLVFSARWTQRYLIRNHQKIMIVDGSRAMIGGFNIDDAYFAPPQANGWNDLGLMIEGDIVPQLGRWFDRLDEWTANPSANWQAFRRLVREWDPENGPVRLLIGGPTRGLSSWARVIEGDLSRGKRLDMMMAYFSPSSRMTRWIGAIAARGAARLLMAGKSDNNATIGATRSLYHYLLGQGVKLWEFQPSKLHTKLIVVDDVVYLGSANFDMRSLYLNLELMLRIEDAALAQRLREFIAQHLPASEEITSEAHTKRANFLNRLRWNLSWFLVTVVDYTVTRRLNLGL